MNTRFIFLSYPSEQKDQIDKVYLELINAGLEPWMDKPPPPFQDRGIPPGAEWEEYLQNQLNKAFLILVFITDLPISGDKYFYKELQWAVEYLRKKPQNSIYIMPVRLSNCHMPTELAMLQWFDLFKDGLEPLVKYIRSIIPTGAKITADDLALINSSWRSPKHDEKYKREVYRFDIVLAAVNEVFDRIDYVIYYLPPAWPNSPVTINNRNSAFGLKDLAWADLLVRAKVFFKNQQDPVALSSFVRLTDNGPQLVRNQVLNTN